MFVDIGEVLGLLAAMEWARELEFKKVIFCLDSKVSGRLFQQTYSR